ncbi:MAG: hypothetical protein QN173_09975 [Armatimonadota bacterium]|nr:hypothetical protein [Armatimonadota bacterium]MDR7400939.1 hypothetical protein [Armatimonadota bacterium]MDR7404743.1 hypothetical protein [Armatimonadota bacterium]MDR7438056.1 hypothetical protein [Armatimonadota bacterium]MDR7472841.1 hypothetical protein [Armatimonadota bacterium]
MSGTAKAAACVLAVVLLVAGLVGTPATAPARPAGSWHLALPWTVKTAWAHHGWSPYDRTLETAIRVAIMVELARQFTQNLNRLVAEQVGRAIKDFVDDVRRGRERDR